MRRRRDVLLGLALSGLWAGPAFATDEADMAAPDADIVVTGTPQERYRANETAAITGFELDPLELPRLVDVIPEQLILDQKITDLGEALRNSPGIAAGDGFGGTNDDFLVRGFRRNAVFRNGFRRDTIFRENVTNIERIQVVRGPASITYGQVEPGGLVDIITKRPLAEARWSGEARYGSFDDRLLLVDVSQPLTASLNLRVVASTQDANSFRDFVTIKRDAIALSADWRVGPGTVVQLGYEYRNESRPLDRGTITVPTPGGREIVNRLIDIPRSRRFGEAFEALASDFHFVDLTLRQELAPGWLLRVGGAYEASVADDIQARPQSVLIFDAGASIGPDGFFTAPATARPVFDDPSDLVFLARRTDGSQRRKPEVVYLNGVLTGDFRTGPLRHRVSFGADFRDRQQTRFFITTPTTNGVPVASGGRGPLFNIRNPNYGGLPTRLSTAGLTPLVEDERTFGFYANDYVDLTDRLSILGGLRYDSVDSDGSGPLGRSSAVSPQLAVNYQFDNASLFASFSRAFLPNTVVDTASGANVPFDPERSTQYEAGGKLNLFGGRARATAAVYRIEKTNVVNFVDELPVLTDGQRSQGVELSLTGQPADGMNVYAGYAYTDAKILTGPDAGNRPTNVAKHTANLWVSYEWSAGALRGLGVGGGAFYVSDRFGDDANSWRLGDYALADLSVWYTLPVSVAGRPGGVRFQLAVKNLTDERYFPASGGDLRVNIGTPRTVFGSISAAF